MRIPLEMRSAKLESIVGIQLHICVLPDRLKEPIPDSRPTCIKHFDEGGFNKGGQQVDNIHTGRLLVRADTFSRFEAPSTGEDGQPSEQTQFSRTQTRATPIQRGTQRLHSWIAGRITANQKF